jgi:hypothetical protein
LGEWSKLEMLIWHRFLRWEAGALFSQSDRKYRKNNFNLFGFFAISSEIHGTQARLRPPCFAIGIVFAVIMAGIGLHTGSSLH